VFADKGYEPIYLYGGYGYFDNMEQSSAPTATPWSIARRSEGRHPLREHLGVADEDLSR